jgi:hypothetical protein
MHWREKAARCPGERPCRSDAWLSCAGSGELAPEVGWLRKILPRIRGS